MKTKVRCPSCRQALLVPASKMGTPLSCPSCGKLTVYSGGGSAPVEVHDWSPPEPEYAVTEAAEEEEGEPVLPDSPPAFVAAFTSYRDAQTDTSATSLAVGGLVLGLVAVVLSPISYAWLCAYAIAVGAVAVLMGLLAASKPMAKGIAIAAIVLGVLSIMVGGVTTERAYDAWLWRWDRDAWMEWHGIRETRDQKLQRVIRQVNGDFDGDERSRQLYQNDRAGWFDKYAKEVDGINQRTKEMLSFPREGDR